MRINIKRFFLTIILPTVLTIGLFILLIFRFIIPYFEQNMLNQKKEMIREIIRCAVSIATTSRNQAQAGVIAKEEAQKTAILQIKNLRYGIENKDYCWITDTRPFMIEHPYRPDLNGSNLSAFVDPKGKKLFAEMVEVVHKSGQGYVDYMWQWMDEPGRIVPKISYVQEFEPWGWIIGTGIYIEDIREEISAIQKKLLGVLLLITALIALLLTFIVRQNLKAEIKRQQAETDLMDSRERYKALVEASSEGTVMILDGRAIYSNKKAENILPGISQLNISDDFHELISPDRAEDIHDIVAFTKGPNTSLRLETRIAPAGKPVVDIILTLSKITLSEKQGYIVIMKELGSLHEANAIQTFADSLKVGYFQVTPGKGGYFSDISQAAVKTLGYDKRSELLLVKGSSLAAEPKEWLKMLRIIDKDGFITRFPLQIRTKEQKYRTVSVSARIVRDDLGNILHSDGLIEDLSEELSQTKAREEMMQNVQNIFLTLYQPVENIISDAVSCPAEASIRQAAELMSSYHSPYLLILDDKHRPAGLVSDGDLVRRVLAQGVDPEQNVTEIMTSPLVTVNEKTSVMQSWGEMTRAGVTQIVVKNEQNIIQGVFSKTQQDSLLFNPLFIRPPDTVAIQDPRVLKNRNQQLPDILAPLINSGCHSRWISTLTTAQADHDIVAITRLAEKELGPPPVPYALIALGSHGRKEPTLTSDQDNALIYQDPMPEQAESCQSYFRQLALRFNPMLAEIGYPLCPGGIMAQTPRWNQPLKVWKHYFDQWISVPDPKNLMETSTFFDLRIVYGENQLVAELKEHVKTSLKKHPALRNLLARECLLYKTPLGLFGKIQTDNDPHGNHLNLKNPLRVMVNLIRLYAISFEIDESNTLLRLHDLCQKEHISQAFARSIEYSYDFLTRLQFRSQLQVIRRHEFPSASVDLTKLTDIEITTIKTIFSEINTFQSKLKHDFSISE